MIQKDLKAIEETIWHHDKAEKEECVDGTPDIDDSPEPASPLVAKTPELCW